MANLNDREGLSGIFQTPLDDGLFKLSISYTITWNSTISYPLS